MTAAECAADLIADDAVVGLGSGRAATAFVQALGRRVAGGLRVRGVATSQATAQLAAQLHIPLVNLDDVQQLAVTVDGADEVDPRLNLIKGLGGALVRERIVAAASARLVIIVGIEKVVPMLGTRAAVPVEVIAFGAALCRRRLEEMLKCPVTPRLVNGGPFVTDNGNHILDCQAGPIADPAALGRSIEAIPGVVDTGLFLGMAETVLIQEGRQGVLVFRQNRFKSANYADRPPWKKVGNRSRV